VPQSILEMAKDLILAQIQAGRLPTLHVRQALQQTYASLSALKRQEETGAVRGGEGSERTPVPVDWQHSISQHTVTCLECGAPFKQLSYRHLATHGLDRRAYRAKYGIPRTQPLSARATTARRRRMVEATRPWERTPQYRTARVREAAQEQGQAIQLAPRRTPRRAPKRHVVASS
jgi:predicted transcriptional regulator